MTSPYASACSLLLVAAALGCRGEPTLDTQTFALQYIDRGTVEGLIEPYVFHDREGAAGTLSFTQNSVTVRETKDNLDRIARLLAEYDIPQPWVRLHFQIIEADGATETDERIAEVETELRKLFRFSGYSLAGEAYISGGANSAVEQGVGDDNALYHIAVEIGEVRSLGDSGFVSLNVNLRGAYGGGLMTRINAREGQTVVLGNARLARARGTTILTVRPEFVRD